MDFEADGELSLLYESARARILKKFSISEIVCQQR